MECLLSCDNLLNPLGYCLGECFTKCPDICKVLLVDGDVPFPPPCSPPPPPPVSIGTIHPALVHGNGNGDNNQKHLIFTSLTVVACLLGASLVIGILCMLFRVCYYRMRRNPSRDVSSSIVFNTQDEFFDEEQGAVVDHPIWYINTVGLPQSVIDSIVAFRFRKGEGLVDGSDCSVCLSEFQDDETLRLLPKCSHAFHLGCIDTWLRSHKNCPLCRAPVVSVDFDVRVDVSVPTSSSEEPRMGSFDASGSSGGLMGNPGGEDGVSEVRIGAGNDSVVGSLIREDEIDGGRLKLDLDHSILRDQFRVQSDLVENREDVGTEMQPIRRSVSLDSSSALAIYNAVSHVIPCKDPGNCDAQRTKHPRVKRVNKRGSTGSLSFRKLMKSSSIGLSLQRGPISMKRSFSSSGKSSSSSSSSSGYMRG